MQKNLAQLNATDLQNIHSNVVGPKYANATIGTFITDLIPPIFVLAGMLMLFYLIYGGYMWMTSQGEPKALQSAKSSVTNAIVGFILVFVSYWIVQSVALMLGLRPIQNIFK